ncbi:MAG: hypothetical protein HOV94_05660 [Saccharothrix sp.]|nr:hypothetical protein [Saccharothrix sp.]
MHASPFHHRLARRLILDVRQDSADLGERLAVLADLAVDAPRLLVDVLVELARHVGDDVVARIVAAPPGGTVAELVDREAHRLHDRGRRDRWVCAGERRYQCARSRRRRQRGA